jgi:hypothetical protein
MGSFVYLRFKHSQADGNINKVVLHHREPVQPDNVSDDYLGHDDRCPHYGEEGIGKYGRVAGISFYRGTKSEDGEGSNNCLVDGFKLARLL